MPATGSAQAEAWQLMLDVFLRQRSRFVALAQEFGLAPTQAIALKHLDPETGTPMSELARVLRCDNSNVTGIADRLEAAGLVERRPSPTDRRVKTLVLTAKGAEIRTAHQRRISTAPPEFQALSDADAATLLEILHQVIPPRGEPLA
jgi:MarR family transcriptional regulator, organic hydroperoxide resistance regulator